MNTYQKIVDEIREKKNITSEQLRILLDEENSIKEDVDYLYKCAREVADEVYGKRVFKRGLIEFTNYCKNDCYYCGIRRSNKCAKRYRLDKETILDCCARGYELGFRI